jgi:hypothetical protein
VIGPQGLRRPKGHRSQGDGVASSRRRAPVGSTG